MKTLEVTALPLLPSELLMVFWHNEARAWWATVSPIESDDVTFSGEGKTPVEALGKLCMEVQTARGVGGST